MRQHNGMMVLIPAGLLCLMLGVLYRPVLQDLVRVWWIDPDYSHGFVIPLVTAYLIWSRKDYLAHLPRRSSLGGGVVLGLGLACYVMSTAVASVGSGRGGLFFAGVSLILVCAGLVLLFWGGSVFRHVAYPIALLGGMLPLPEGIFNLITLPLQSYATSVTTSALHMLQIPAFREGHLVHLPQLTLSVTEACSGIRSFLTLLTGALILSAMMLSRWWQRVVLIISVIPIAILANAARVTGTGILAHTVGQHLAEGFFHGFAGWIMLLLGACSLCAEILLLSRLADVEKEHA